MVSNNVFNRKSLDGHICNYNWTVGLRGTHNQVEFIYQVHSSSNYCQDSRSQSLREPECQSTEFSMSNTCPVKWKMVFQEVSNQSFKIGIMKINAEKLHGAGSCSMNISNVRKEISKKISFYIPYLQQGETCFSEVISLSPTNGIRWYTEVADKKVYIDGMINIQNCCEVKKKEQGLVDKNISQLQQDFKTFFKAKQITDVTLNVGDEVLYAHKFVLSARSPVFQKMFSQDMVEGNRNNVHVEDIDKPVMEVFLSFLYTGVIEDNKFNTIFELYSVADKYEVATLFETCQNILTSYITIDTVIPVLKLADMHSDDKLKDIAAKYICDNFLQVETTAEWDSLLDTHPRLASYTLRKVSSSISN